MNSDNAGRAIQVGRYVADPTLISMSVVTSRIQLKPYTHYRLWASVDAFFRFGDGASNASTSSNPITAKLDTLHVTDGENIYLSGIVSSGTGTMFVSEVETKVN